MTGIMDKFRKARANLKTRRLLNRIKKLERRVLEDDTFSDVPRPSKAVKEDQARKVAKDALEQVTKTQLKIYDIVRKWKVKNGEIIEFKGYELDVDKNRKNLFTKLGRWLSNTKIDQHYIGFYLGYGRQIRVIDIPVMQDKSVSFDDLKRQFNVKDHEKPWYCQGKTVLWIDPHSIFNPNLDRDKEEFLYDIDPTYYYRLTNDVFDITLTQPKHDGLFGKGFNLKKALLLGGIAAIAYYLYTSNKGVETVPALLVPFFSLDRTDKRGI